MFETVAVSSSLAKALDALKSKWNDLSSLFAKGFKVGLGDVTPRFETIKKGLQSIKDSLLGIDVYKRQQMERRQQVAILKYLVCEDIILAWWPVLMEVFIHISIQNNM